MQWTVVTIRQIAASSRNVEQKGCQAALPLLCCWSALVYKRDDLGTMGTQLQTHQHRGGALDSQDLDRDLLLALGEDDPASNSPEVLLPG